MASVRLLGYLFVFVCMIGCNSSGKFPVSGTVKFADGTIPQGEIATLLFNPVSPGPQAKPASGDIKPDGTFTLIEDGAFPGEYKVTFNVWKTYLGRESLVESKSTSAATTPHTVKVTPGGPNKFDFVLEKAVK